MQVLQDVRRSQFAWLYDSAFEEGVGPVRNNMTFIACLQVGDGGKCG